MKPLFPLLFGVSLLLFACGGGGEKVEHTLFVSGISIPCQESGPRCLQIREKADTAWTLYPGQIEGLEYQEGMDYELRVAASPDAGAPIGWSYELLEVLKQEASPLYAGDQAPSTLENATWHVQAMGPADNLHALIGTTSIHARFFPEKQQVSGLAGCNNYFGYYEVNGNQLAIDSTGTTRKACKGPAGVMDQEQEYMSLLGQSREFRIEKGQLILSSPEGAKIIFQGR